MKICQHGTDLTEQFCEACETDRSESITAIVANICIAICAICASAYLIFSIYIISQAQNKPIFPGDISYCDKVALRIHPDYKGVYNDICK